MDADGQILGRFCARIATLLRGKHRPEFTSNWDYGDHVVVINAEKIKVTGDKANQKVYFQHSQYPGGAKFTPFNKMLKEKPDRIIIHAVKGMLPKGKLGRHQLRKLKVYAGVEHPHQAQTPIPWTHI
jgi:large subunit ribosomal protein L13